MYIQTSNRVLFCFFMSFLVSSCMSPTSWTTQALQNGANSPDSFEAVNAGGASGEEVWQNGATRTKCKDDSMDGSCF